MNSFRLFNDLLIEAKERKASDMLFTVNSIPTLMINGIWQDADSRELSDEDTEEIFHKLLLHDDEKIRDKYSLNAGDNTLIARFMKEGHVDFTYNIPQVCRYRINIYRQRGCFAFAVRLIQSVIPQIDSLQVPAIAKEFARKSHGLVIITGPVSSGKSTTTAALIDYLNSTYRYHILTLENPIEYVYEHKLSKITQREVYSDVASFSSGLKAAVRQNCKVILIGELRDTETIKTALNAAEKGHLVFATMATFDAVEAIESLINSVEDNDAVLLRTQLASVLVGIIAQRLIPRIEGASMILACEILVNTSGIRNLIRNADISAIRDVIQTSSNLGMRTMRESIQELVDKRIISAEYLRDYDNSLEPQKENSKLGTFKRFDSVGDNGSSSMTTF